MGSARVRHPRSRSWLRRLVLPAAGVVALALVAAGCTNSSSSSTASGSSTPLKGGTAVFAEPPDSPPDYIFPFMD